MLLNYRGRKKKNPLLSPSRSSGARILCCCCSVKTSQQSSTDLHCPVDITQLVCVRVCVCEGFPGLKGSIETSSPSLLSLPCRGDQLPTLGCDGWNIYHSVYRPCLDSRTMSPRSLLSALVPKNFTPTPDALTLWCQSSLPATASGQSRSTTDLLAVTLSYCFPLCKDFFPFSLQCDSVSAIKMSQGYLRGCELPNKAFFVWGFHGEGARVGWGG